MPLGMQHISRIPTACGMVVRLHIATDGCIPKGMRLSSHRDDLDSIHRVHFQFQNNNKSLYTLADTTLYTTIKSRI